MLAVSACGGRPSEAEARAAVKELAASALLQPPPGEPITSIETRACQGDSDANLPTASRSFRGSAADTAQIYRQRLDREGWTGFRDLADGGGFAASKDDREFLFTSGSRADTWTVTLFYGSDPAKCKDPYADERGG